MRFVVYGAGAVGGVLGALLYRSGDDVTLIARGEHLAAIQSNGLTLQTPAFEETLQIPAVGFPEEVSWRGDETVILAVKIGSMAKVLPRLRRWAPPTVAVVCAQNGVANEPTALRWFADVYGVCVMVPTTHLEPGVVAARSAPTAAILDIGRYPSGVDDTARAVAAGFEHAGVVSETRPDIMRWKYRKLLHNLRNIVDACCVRDEDAGELGRRAVLEGEAVLAAAGVEVASAQEDVDRRGGILRLDSSREASSGSSTWQSLVRGTGSVETDYLNGEIVREGRLRGVATPVNGLLQHLGRRQLAASAPPRSVPARALLDELEL